MIFSITGCKDKRASLEKQYTEARLLFQQGYIDQPLPLAEAGFKESAGYPDLNWRFRVLTAEARNRKKLFAAALELLEPEPPSNIPSEILVASQNHPGFVSLPVGQGIQQAEEHFAQAAALHAEPGALNYARGRCAMSSKHELKTAENYLASGYCAKLKSRPFSQGLCAGHSRVVSQWDLRYEEAIDLNKECLTILRSLHAPPLEELVLGNLGDLYVDLGDFNKAEPNSEAAEKIASQLKDGVTSKNGL